MSATRQWPARTAVGCLVLLSACLKASTGANPGNTTAPLLPPVLETLDGAPLSALDFATLAAGNEATRSGALRNPNAITIGIQVTGLEAPAAFAIAGVDGEIQPGARVNFEVRFAPKSAGVSTATASLAVAEGTAATLALTGAVIDPPCDALPNGPVNFGFVSVGGEGSLELTIANPLTVAWTLPVPASSGADAAAFPVEHAHESVTVPASGTLKLAVGFKPTVARGFVADLAFTAGGSCELRTVTLQGQGVPSVVECASEFASASPACELDFGYVDLQHRATRFVAFRNRSYTDVTLQIGVVTQPDGKGSPFSTAPEHTAFVLPGTGQLVFNEVAFTPTSVGDQVGSIAFATTDPGLPTGTIALRGHGGGPAIELDPTAIAFESTIVGSTATRTLRITNSSPPADGAMLLFGDYENEVWVPAQPVIESSEFAFDPLTAAQLAAGIAPGESLSLPVHFVPASKGVKAATLRLRTNVHGGAETSVDLSGTALAPCALEARPAFINFGTMDWSRERTLNLLLVNTAADPSDECIVSVESTVAGTVYTLPDGLVSNAVIRGGESLVVPVQLLPGQPDGAVSDSIKVRFSNPSAPEFDVPLVGEIGAMAHFLSEMDIDFHTIGTNCNSGERVISVWATGTATQIDTIALMPGSSPSFTLTRLPALPASIAANGRVQIGITYRPTQSGEDRGSAMLTAPGYSRGIVITLHGRSSTDPMQTDVFTIPTQAQKDVLMLFDSSCSMADKQRLLSSMYAHLFDAAGGTDYRLAQLPPYDTGVRDDGNLLPRSGSAPCFTTRTRTCSYTDVTRSGPSSLLWPAFLALSRPNISGWNAGFLREDASLSVVVVTDTFDTDSRNMPIEFYEDFFWSIKGRNRRELFDYSGFAATLVSSPYGCSYDSSGVYNTRAKDVATLTNGLLQDVCAMDAAAGTALSNRIFALRKTYSLLSKPDMTRTPDPIEVTLDGVAFPAIAPGGGTRWRYDSAGNAIVFDPASLPPSGSTLTISYHVKCL